MSTRCLLAGLWLLLATSLSACSDAGDGDGAPASDVASELSDQPIAPDAPDDPAVADTADDGDDPPTLPDTAPDGNDAAGDASDVAAPDGQDDAPSDLDDDSPADAVLDSDTAADGDTLADGDADEGRCVGDEQCEFGHGCDDGQCVPLECHLGDYALGLADKPCPTGQICAVLLDPPGPLACVQFEQSCTFHSECPFGFRCEIGWCTLADCTIGQGDAGYGPRPCEDAGEICACMEDGPDLNGGRGVCVLDPLECS
jgi:hypothetical protein